MRYHLYARDRRDVNWKRSRGYFFFFFLGGGGVLFRVFCCVPCRRFRSWRVTPHPFAISGYIPSPTPIGRRVIKTRTSVVKKKKNLTVFKTPPGLRTDKTRDVLFDTCVCVFVYVRVCVCAFFYPGPRLLYNFTTGQAMTIYSIHRVA